MADEIEIVPYDPEWPRLFEAERDALTGVLPKNEPRQILHFGSTAVPGLSAKPIIDILLIVRDLTQARAVYPDRLTKLGYVFWADNPKTDRLFFVKGMPPYGDRRTHHIHVTQPDGELAARVAFIDYLRAHPEVAAAYADLKHRLAKEHRDDRETYTAAKAEFIQSVMETISKSSL